ncbi:MAG: BamA/TamA family outer membrane protein, partial [Calditrichia bacterium]|nr:BamA/TamA family outer membrane protein [Calditrichia bacterium]
MKNQIIILILLSTFIYGQNNEPDKSKIKPSALMVEAIHISGNSKTNSTVILNNIDFKEGNYINQEILIQNTFKLENTNFFKEVNVYTQPGSNRGNVVVFIEVKERKWPFFQFKSEFNELDGWYISPAGIRFDNIFGRGNYLGIEMLFGYRMSGLNLSWLRPRLMNSNWDFRMRIFTRERQFIHYLQEIKYMHKVNWGGISFRFNGNSGLLKYLWFEYKSETFRTEDEIFMADSNKVKQPIP